MEVSERSAKNYLKELRENGLIKKISHGKYVKVQFSTKNETGEEARK